jgi:hypothetical protein
MIYTYLADNIILTMTNVVPKKSIVILKVKSSKGKLFLHLILRLVWKVIPTEISIEASVKPPQLFKQK